MKEHLKPRPHVLFVGADFEFIISVLQDHFHYGKAVMPGLAYGHLLKSWAKGLLTWFEKLFVGINLEALGYTPNSSAYNYNLQAGHISKSNKLCVLLFYSMVKAVARRYLASVGHTRKIKNKTLKYWLSNPSTASTGQCVILDENGRPQSVNIPMTAVDVASDMLTWWEKECGSHAKGDKEAFNVSDVRGLGDDIEHIWIDQLKVRDKVTTTGTVLGVASHC